MLKTSIWADLTKKTEIYLLRKFSNLNRALECSVTPYDIHFRTEITQNTNALVRWPRSKAEQLKWIMVKVLDQTAPALSQERALNFEWGVVKPQQILLGLRTV